MLRVPRGPLAWAVAASVILAACGGAAGPGGQATTAPGATPTPTSDLGTAARPIIMAFVPSQDTARVTSSGRAIAASLEAATGLKWDVRVPTSYAATIEGMCSGQIDVAWLAPLSYVLANNKGCAEVILGTLRRDQTGNLATTYKSQILVRTDSGIDDIEGLRGKKFAFTDPLSTSGRLYPTVLVKQQTGEDPNTFFSDIQLAGGHDKAVLALYQGQVDGAASFIDVRDNLIAQFPDIKEVTKRIAEAGPIPNDTVSIRPDFPADLKTKIQEALLAYATTDAGKAALKALYNIDGLGRVDPAVFDPLKDAADLAGIDLEGEAAKTARPVATPTPTPTQTP